MISRTSFILSAIIADKNLYVLFQRVRGLQFLMSLRSLPFLGIQVIVHMLTYFRR